MKLIKLTRTNLSFSFVLVAGLLIMLQLTVPFVSLAQEAEITQNQTIENKIEDVAEEVKFTELFDTLTVDTTEVKVSELETITSKVETDPLQTRKELLYKYFTTVRPSRFAESVDTLAEQPHWRKVTAIAFVESTLGKHCYYNNCWGITYSSGLARFESLDVGIKVENDLIARRYADKTYQQMNCVYVQPCNPAWVKGVLQIEAELDKYVESNVIHNLTVAQNN